MPHCISGHPSHGVFIEFFILFSTCRLEIFLPIKSEYFMFSKVCLAVRKTYLEICEEISKLLKHLILSGNSSPSP
jgi:hypothetical protein